MKKTRNLRNTFITVGLLFMLVQLLAASSSDSVLDFGSTPIGSGIVTFDAPGAGTDPMQGTIPVAITSGGTIAGYYFDDNAATHGFVRRTDGTATTFDAPGGGTGPYQGTYTESINSAGAITGFTRDAVNGFHGYLR